MIRRKPSLAQSTTTTSRSKSSLNPNKAHNFIPLFPFTRTAINSIATTTTTITCSIPHHWNRRRPWITTSITKSHPRNWNDTKNKADDADEETDYSYHWSSCVGMWRRTSRENFRRRRRHSWKTNENTALLSGEIYQCSRDSKIEIFLLFCRKMDLQKIDNHRMQRFMFYFSDDETEIIRLVFCATTFEGDFCYCSSVWY